MSAGEPTLEEIVEKYKNGGYSVESVVCECGTVISHMRAPTLCPKCEKKHRNCLRGSFINRTREWRQTFLEPLN